MHASLYLNSIGHIQIQSKFIHKLSMDNISIELQNHSFSLRFFKRVMPIEFVKKNMKMF